MPTYEVVAPCAYARDGRLVRHRRPGAIIELDEVTATLLGSKVKPVTPKRRPRESKTRPQEPVSPPDTTPGSDGGDTPPPATNPIEALLGENDCEMGTSADGE